MPDPVPSPDSSYGPYQKPYDYRNQLVETTTIASATPSRAYQAALVYLFQASLIGFLDAQTGYA
jgi:hypothetical protein